MDVAKDWHRIAYEAERARDNAVAQLEYEQSNRRKNDAEIAHERDDFIKELETANADLRAALVAIQELAVDFRDWQPMDSRDAGEVYPASSVEDLLDDIRRLAEDALATRTTKNGDAT